MSLTLRLTPFFSSDDWFHLRLTNVNSFGDFLNFFSFQPTAQSASFYRPLSTQVFFFVFQKIFGLNPLPYYLFGIAIFALILVCLYHFVKTLTTKRTAVYATLIYAVSVTNFTRLFFLSAYQELFLVLFSLLSLSALFKKRKWLSLVYFVLALLSKETAIVLPLIALILTKLSKKISFRSFLPQCLIAAIYLYFRLFVFKGVAGDSYQWDFSPLRATNTLFWYSIWSLGAPELLVDYVSSGLRILPRFFTDYPVWSKIILSQLILTLVSAVVLFVSKIRKNYGHFFAGIAIFVVSLLPVLFLPWHKFTLELGLPLIGFSFAFASMVKKDIVSYTFVTLFIVFNLSMWPLTYSRNYAVSRGVICRRVFDYINSNYPKKPNGYFEFINDTVDYGKEWGSSKQLFNAMGGSELFRVLYKDSEYKVYFEDIGESRPSVEKIPLSTKKFLSNTIDTK